MNISWPWQHIAEKGEARAKMRPENTKSSTGFIAMHAAGEAQWSGHDYLALAREGYMRNPVVHRCVRIISESAAAVPWLLYDGTDELEDHPVLDLLRSPNAHQAGASFLETLYSYLLISGDAYIERIDLGNGTHELHLLRPDRVETIADARGWPEAYIYRVGSIKRTIPAATQTLMGDGVMHIKLFHPLDDLHGFAPISAALMALDLHNAAGKWNKALLDNSARPSGALVYAPSEGGNLTPEQFDRLKAELEDGYSGAHAAGKPLLLEGGLDWKSMALSPKDMDFVEAKNAASRDIALAFGVPPMLLGIPGDNTYSNYLEANRAFIRQTIMPMVGRLAHTLSDWISQSEGRKLRLWYDADSIEGLAHEREALWRRLGDADFLTANEKREALGYSPIDANQLP